MQKEKKKINKKIPINNVDQTRSDERGIERVRSVLIFKRKAKITSGGIMTSRKRASFSLRDNKIYNNGRERLKGFITQTS